MLNIYGIAHRYTGILDETIEVLRSPATVGVNGRVRGQQVPVFRYAGILAKVVARPPGNLVRQPEYETMVNSIEVMTDFPLQGPSPDMLADRVVWHGQAYVVINLQEYSKMGDGYIDALCQLIEMPGPADVDSGPFIDSSLVSVEH